MARTANVMEKWTNLYGAARNLFREKLTGSMNFLLMSAEKSIFALPKHLEYQKNWSGSNPAAIKTKLEFRGLTGDFWTTIYVKQCV